MLDRVGGGDGFASGFFYGLLTGEPPEEAVKLGWAHGALLTTFPGDTTMATLEQVAPSRKAARPASSGNVAQGHRVFCGGPAAFCTNSDIILRMRSIVAVAACLLISGCCLKAQTVSYGVVGGVLLAGSPEPSPGPHREDKRYTVGALIEFGLTKHIAVEFSPLYKRFGYSATGAAFGGSCPPDEACTNPPPTYFAVRERENAWEFPIVGKYYFGKQRRSWRPFVLTGYSFTKSWISLRESGFPAAVPGGTSQVASTGVPATPLGVGAVFGGGIVAHKGPAWIGPEFRYTRNGVSGKNQAEVLVSVRF